MKLSPRLSMDAAALAAFYRATLLEDVLPFWFPRSVDVEHGGYLHCCAADGSIVDTDKSVWAQGRMAWMVLTLYNTWEPRPEWLAWGQHGVEFLNRYGFDAEGRMFFTLTRDGRPLRQRRYAYSEAFLCIAAAALFRATGDEAYRELAVRLFRQFVEWNFTPGRMPPKFTAQRPMVGIGPRMIALTTAQSLRSDLGPDQEWTTWIDRCIHEIETLFVKHDQQVVMESVTPTGAISDHFDGRLLNPGHAIEAAWFVLEEGAYRNRPDWIRLGCQMLDYSWRRGWDPEYGGLFYFRDLAGLPVSEYWHDMKFWWPHNEAIIATLYAVKLTGQSSFADWHEQVHAWSFRHFADPEHGEWFGYLQRDGRLSNTLKGNHWKSCFHYPRMLWKCVQILSS